MPWDLLIPPHPDHIHHRPKDGSFSTTLLPLPKKRDPIKRLTNSFHLKSQDRGGQRGRHCTTDRQSCLLVFPPTFTPLLLFLITKYARYPAQNISFKEVSVPDTHQQLSGSTVEQLQLFNMKHAQRHTHTHINAGNDTRTFLLLLCFV